VLFPCPCACVTATCLPPFLLWWERIFFAGECVDGVGGCRHGSGTRRRGPTRREMDPKRLYRLGDPGRCLAIAIQGYKGLWGPGLRDGRLLLAGEEMGTGPPPHRIDGRRSKVQGAKDESCCFRLPADASARLGISLPNSGTFRSDLTGFY